jgi:hypothetical protein
MTTTAETIFQPQPEAPLGTLPGVITDIVVEYGMETKYGTKDLVKWFGTVTDDEGTDYRVDAMTSTSTRKGSRAHAWLKALGLDPSKPLSREDIVGKAALFVLVEDDQGFTKVGDIVAPPKSK